MTVTHETDEFEDWARLAASIGQYTQRRREVDAPRADDTSRPGGKSKSNAVNGHETANGHVNGNGVKVDQLPNFLLQGPDVDDEPPASEPDRGAVAENGAIEPRVTAAGSAVPASFLLTDALSEDLEIPPEPAMPPVGELQRPSQRTVRRKAKNKKERPSQRTVRRKAKNKKERPPATEQQPAMSPVGELQRLSQRTVRRKAKNKKEPATEQQPTAAEKPPRTEGPRPGFDGLPSSPVAAKQVGISAPLSGDRPGLSWRRLENLLRKGVTVTAVGVTIGGVAVAILYIAIIATTTVF